MSCIRSLLLTLVGVAALAGVASAQMPRTPAAEVAALRADLREILGEPRPSRGEYGILVVSLDRGDTLFALSPDAALAPASNLKLYSTAAVLYYLGPEFRYSTTLYAAGPVRDGVLEGDLILHGTGDPSISGRMLGSADATFRALADTLRAAGIREVRGDLVGDGSYFDAEWRGAAWNPADLLDWYAAPIGALTYAENMVTVRVRPGAAGGPARIETVPATDGLALDNRVVTVARGATRVRFEHGPAGLVVAGQIGARDAAVVQRVPVADPANYAAAAFRAILAEEGVRVTGRTRAVASPDSSSVALAGRAGGDRVAPRLLATHLSPTLREIVGVTNHISHNLFAEALLKTVGRVARGEGSFEAGGRAVEDFLARETRVDSAALYLADGSGLSRTNRVSAGATVALLEYMTRSGIGEVYRGSLPEAGSRGGLRRMYETPAAGNLRAKTGTIHQVSALSGYVRTAEGERLIFSIIANGLPSTTAAKRLEDAIGARIARFRRGAPALTPPEG